jgi:hypothetical protein
MGDSKSGQTLLQALRDVWLPLRKPEPPPDPYADRLVPVRRGPKGRSGATAAEPEDDSHKSFHLEESKRCARFSVPPCLRGEIMLLP